MEAMALSGTPTKRPISNSVAALFLHDGKIKKRLPRETRLHVLFRVNQKASPADSVFISCSTNDNCFSIDAKFMFNNRPDPFQNDGHSTLEQALKEIRETQWQVNSHKGSFRVAYQGVPGAYSEEAAMAAHPGCHALPCPDYETALRSVELHNADRVILPVESTVQGTIHANYDLLLHHDRLHVVGEFYFPVQYCLLVLPGVSRAEIGCVVSHRLAILQCERTLASLGLGDASRKTTDDTTSAADYVSRNNLRHTAAIASARAAEIYGLRVVARGIQDEYSNLTRFLILALQPADPAADRPHKTSIVIGHDGNSVDALFRVLSTFPFRGINLSKLESKPGPGRKRMTSNPLRGEVGLNVQQFQHVFYIDFEASMADRRAQNALAELQEFTTFMRVLGSYPADPKHQEI
jgi:arogenate/prephenate dehydratase